MLLLTRRIGERLVVGSNIWLKIMGVKGRQVILGIDAPVDVPVHREEIHERINLEGSQKEHNSWKKKMQLYDMLSHRYHFDILDGSLHFISDDNHHEGAMTMTQHERLNMFVNITRLLETISKGEFI